MEALLIPLEPPDHTRAISLERANERLRLGLTEVQVDGSTGRADDVVKNLLSVEHVGGDLDLEVHGQKAVTAPAEALRGPRTNGRLGFRRRRHPRPLPTVGTENMAVENERTRLDRKARQGVLRGGA